MKKMEMVKEEDPSSQLSLSPRAATTGAATTPRSRQAYHHYNIDIESESESPTQTFLTKHRCCFSFPCFGSPHRPTRNRIRLGVPTTTIQSSSSYSTSPSSNSIWDKLQAAENEQKWWTTPITAFKKIREWSEIVAGPKWKTFIRRFNRNGCTKGYQGINNNGNGANYKIYQYDPSSYALNFDEGGGRNNEQFDDEDYGYYPDFTSRYVKVAVNGNSGNKSANSVADALNIGHNSNTATAGTAPAG